MSGFDAEDRALGDAFRQAMSIDGWALCEVLVRASGGERAWAAIACPVRADGTWLRMKSRNGFGRNPTEALQAVVKEIRTYETKARP